MADLTCTFSQTTRRKILPCKLNSPRDEALLITRQILVGLVISFILITNMCDSMMDFGYKIEKTDRISFSRKNYFFNWKRHFLPKTRKL